MKRVGPGSLRALGVSLLVTLSLIASADSVGSSPEVQAAGFPSLRDTVAQASVSAPSPLVSNVEPPLSHDRLIELVRQTWPDDPDGAARILICESHAGDDSKTWDVDAPSGGPMQLDHFTWAPYFEANYGWTWNQVVTDIHIHLQAARIVYDRAGGWEPWSC